MVYTNFRLGPPGLRGYPSRAWDKPSSWYGRQTTNLQEDFNPRSVQCHIQPALGLCLDVIVMDFWLEYL